MGVSETPARQRMIETAGRLFAGRGYAATSMRGIVEAAKAPWGSVHHYFPGGKEQIGLAAIELGDQLVRASLVACLEQASTPAEAVSLWFDVAARNLKAGDFEVGCPVATVALETASDANAMGTACATSFAGWRSLLAKAFRDTGVPAKRARELATVVVTNFEGALLLSRVSRSTEPLRLAAETVAGVLDAELAPSAR